MSKRFTAALFLFVICTWLPPIPGLAQEQAATIQTLTVDLWPDYDQESVLVLLTGQLPPDVPLPAAVTLPLPPEARLNAVARITNDGIMSDDLPEPVQTAETVTFITPDSRFRVEYYFPYTTTGTQHAFTFSWTAAAAVTELTVVIQQPAAAANISLTPTAVTASTNDQDGLTYHVLPTQSVAPGQPFTVEVAYQMPTPQLTVTLLQAGLTGETAAAPPAANTSPLAANWPLYLAALGTALVGIAMFWQVFAQRQAASRSRTKPAKKQKPAPAKFCHQCGQSSRKLDTFCRQCGTRLKT